MQHFRVTVRWGSPPRYHVEDVRAAGLAAVFEQLPGALPPDVLETGDLVEIRVQADPETRDFTPG
jgi:hypothetical protein